MFILSSVSSGLDFFSVNHTWLYDNSESNVSKNRKFLVEISNKATSLSLHLSLFYL